MSMLNKNLNNILYAIFSIFSITWYLYLAKFLIPECIDNYYIHITIYFLVPVLSTFIPKLLKYKSSRNEKNQELTIICDLVNVLAIFANIYMITYYISSNFFIEYAQIIVNIVSIIIMLLLVTYCLHITIKKLVKTTYSKSIVIVSLIILLGWFNSQELTLIAILSIILNTIVSIDDRTNLISFLKKKEIGNEFIWKQNTKGKLTKKELRGKFIAQKITIYIIIALMYIIIKITENRDFSLYIYSVINHAELNSYPQIAKYLFRGIDRILASILVFLVLYFEKKSIQILRKIFGL